MNPKLYLAPIMGVTNHIFRNIYVKHFSGLDYAVAPFVSASMNKRIKKAMHNELKRENNQLLPLIPQILGNDAQQILNLIDRLIELGYNEINWNAGCPFPRVTKKKRGSGLIPHPEMIERILDGIFSKCKCEFSIKLRLGLKKSDEILKIIPILNNYRIKNITIHTRTAIQMYSGEVNLDIFEECLKLSKHELIYNGDIFDNNIFNELNNRFKKVGSWMIGRGLLRNPFLPSIIKGKKIDNVNKLKKIREFHDDLLKAYLTTYPTERHVLDKMKEIWTNLCFSFDDSQKVLKKIIKCKSIEEYIIKINEFI